MSDAPRRPTQEEEYDAWTTILAAGVVLIGGAVVMGMHRYKVAAPTQYIVRTGLGIADIAISKTAFLWPFQRAFTLELAPSTYSFVVSAMSNEKLSFQLPVNFTVGPKDEPETLAACARFVAMQDAVAVSSLVKGVIEGEARVLAASLSVEDIFKDRVSFKRGIVDSVDAELRKFGLTVWNANVKDLQDTEGSEYFQYLRQKAVEGAVNQAKIDVSEARMRGDIGEKMRQGQTRQEVARIEADTVETETKRQADIALSASTLRVRKAEAEAVALTAEIVSRQSTATRDAELEAAVNVKKAQAEIERLRSTQLMKEQVDAEALVMRAKGEAEASVCRAQGDADAMKRAADAALYRERAEAEAVLAKYEATSKGMSHLRTALGGDASTLLQYMMVDRNMFVELAAKNAQAVQGLAPKITVWQTDSGATGGGAAGREPFKSIADVYRMLPPLMTTVAEQTGMKPPEWMLQLPASEVKGAEVPAAVVVAPAAAGVATASASVSDALHSGRKASGAASQQVLQ